MQLQIDIPNYDGQAQEVIWYEDADYTIDVFDGEVALTANREGLISLARQMLYMAYNDLPEGSHVHYDPFLTGKERACELILVKKYKPTA